MRKNLRVAKLRRVAIVQSNYIPWKGYFDLIARSDVFVLLDDVQYTKRDWRNRNLIKSRNGPQWLSVPVLTKGKYYQKISETQLDGDLWRKEHFSTLQANYAKAPFFNDTISWLRPCYFDYQYESISHLNLVFITAICKYLGITTQILSSSQFSVSSDKHKSDRLLDICKCLNATEYISGPKAKSYLNERLFLIDNVKVSWMSYDNYPSYPQLWGQFDHYVSILDLIFNCGNESVHYMKYTR